MKSIIIGLTLFALTACASLQSDNLTARLSVQYATLKVMENSSSVTQADVLEAVAKARSVVDTNLTVDVTQIREALGLDRLSPSDELLVGAVIGDIELRLLSAPLSEDERVARLLTILDWIETAATLS